MLNNIGIIIVSVKFNMYLTFISLLDGAKVYIEDGWWI